MNEFYRNKAGLPREVKNADTLCGALEAWKEKRLLNVVKACMGTDDKFRKNFGIMHQEYADSVDAILLSVGSERELSESLLRGMESRFKAAGLSQAGPGWLREASGLCGAELEKILNSE